MSEGNLLYCDSSLLAWLVSPTLHNLFWISAYSWMDKQHENYLTKRHMCVFAISVWNLNKVNNKSKCIHHGDLTVIQQPVISCWRAHRVAIVLSPMESVFFKVVQCLSLCFYSANTRDRKSLLRVSSCWWDCSYFHWTYCQHHMGQVLSFIESDLIRDNYMRGNHTAGYKIFTRDQYRCEQYLSALPSILEIKDVISETFLTCYKCKHQSITNSDDQKICLGKSSGAFEDFTEHCNQENTCQRHRPCQVCTPSPEVHQVTSN